MKWPIREVPIFISLIFFVLPLPLRAVLVGGGDGTQNAGLPTPVVGAIGNNIGLLNSATGVYIGNGWVLTAFHVGAHDISFPALNATFTYDGSSVRLLNPDSSPADLLLFHLTTAPALANMRLASTTGTALAAGQKSVIMVGTGQSRATTLSYFDTSTNPWTASSTQTTQTEAGYFYGGPAVLRYGPNNVVEAQAQTDDGFGKTDTFSTDFNPSQNSNALAQGSLGDSGGSVFDQDLLGNFELSGLILAIDRTNPSSSPGQPNNTAVYSTTAFGGLDSLTFAADLSSYRAQIVTTTGVPEPSSVLLAFVGGLALFALRRRTLRS